MITAMIYREAPCPLSNAIITRVVKAAGSVEKKINGRVTIILLSKAKMRKYNYRYRGKNAVTDVLSFAWQEGETKPIKMLGEVYLCYEKIASQAKEFGVKNREEFVRMLTHGLLHLAGHDHVRPAEAKRMFMIQEKIVAKAKV